MRIGSQRVLAALAEREDVDLRGYHFRFSATAVVGVSGYAWLSKSVLVATAAWGADHVWYAFYQLI